MSQAVEQVADQIAGRQARAGDVVAGAAQGGAERIADVAHQVVAGRGCKATAVAGRALELARLADDSGIGAIFLAAHALGHAGVSADQDAFVAGGSGLGGEGRRNFASAHEAAKNSAALNAVAAKGGTLWQRLVDVVRVLGLPVAHIEALGRVLELGAALMAEPRGGKAGPSTLYSQSAMHNVEANLLNKATVHRAMFRTVVG